MEHANWNPTQFITKFNGINISLPANITTDYNSVISRFGLTSEELDKIFSCYTGYKMKRKENNEFIEEVIKGMNHVLLKV